MDILLVGGAGSLMNALIDKLNKEGHRVYVLTGQKDGGGKYRNVFEKYNFPYESDCLKEIYDSVNPQVVLFLGAYDTNYTWKDARRESVQYSAGLINLLMSYSAVKQGRFIYLSTEEVYQDSYPADIREMEPEQPKELRTLAIAQGEELCINYHRSMGVDVTILRLDHLYQPPKTKDEISEVCGRMCMSALNRRKIPYNGKHSFSMLYMADAVEFIYQVIRKKEHEHTMYHVSTGAVLNEKELAVLVQKAFGLGEDALINDTVGKEIRVVLSNEAFGREYDIHVFYPAERGVQRIAEYMRRHRRAFTENNTGKKGFWAKLFGRTESIVKALLPFAENCICFIPFFMLNNRAVGSDYFANLDFYMLYVLLFAIVYGQQQATFSAILAVAGYCFRQAYNRSGFEVLLDYNTYVWVAQLFILGLAVCHLRV